MSRFVCFGEMLLRLSSPGKERLFQTQSLETNFVGAEANVGVTLSRLGNEVEAVTVVPDNPVGLACEKTLQAEGLNTRHIVREGPRLAVYYLETGALIRPSVITYDRANSSFALAAPDVFDWMHILEGADYLHICGITLAVSESSYQSSLNAIEAAESLGVKVSFDCNYRAALWAGREARAVEQIKQVISRSHILFGGPRDCNLLLGTDIDTSESEAAFKQASESFFDAFESVQVVATTHRIVHSPDSNDLSGFIADRSGFANSRVFRLDGIVDRIGGGDAFAGGVLHKVAQSAALQDTITFGTAASAIKHSIPGDFNRTSEAEVTALATSGTLDVQR